MSGSGSSGIARLAEELRDGDSEEARRAANALAAIGPPAVSALVEVLADMGGYSWTQELAADALVRIGEPAVPALVDALKTSGGFEEDDILGVLVRIGAPAIPALERGLEDWEFMVCEDEVRDAVAQIRRNLGQDTAPAVENRVPMGDPGGDYRQQAVNQILASFAGMTEAVGAAARGAAQEGKLPQQEADELARHGRALTSDLEASARGAGYTGPGLAPKPEARKGLLAWMRGLLSKPKPSEVAPTDPSMAASSGPIVVWLPRDDDPTFGSLLTNEDKQRAVAASQHNDRGVSCYERSDYDGAIAEYRRALRIKPDYAMAHQNLANALGMKGRDLSSPDLLEKGIHHMKEALRICPGFERAERNLPVLEAHYAVVGPRPRLHRGFVAWLRGLLSRPKRAEVAPTDPSKARRRVDREYFLGKEVLRIPTSGSLHCDLCDAEMKGSDSYANPYAIRDSIPLSRWPQILRENDPARVSKLYCRKCFTKYVTLVCEGQKTSLSAHPNIIEESNHLAIRHLQATGRAKLIG